MAAVASSSLLTPFRKQLLSMSKPTLIKTCKKYRVSTYGSKKDMIGRIMAAKSMKNNKKPSSPKKKKKKKKKKMKSTANILQLENSTTEEAKQNDIEPQQQQQQINDDIIERKEENKESEEEKDDEKDPKILINKQYNDSMNKIETYGIYCSIEGLCDRSSFKSHINDPADPNTDNFKKIMKEIRKELPKNIYISSNGSMFIRFDENHPRFIQALLTGIENTPYSNGMFLFDIYLPSSYPQIPCNIKHITYGATLCHANNGPGGFSPNLHQTTGKVCLSLLGTWNGPGWKPGKSNVYQVLSSLLFMVFGAKHPFYMEPGFGGWEKNILKKKKHIKKVWQYDEEVMYHNVKYAMLQTLKVPYKGFEDVIKIHFKIKGNIILKTIKKWMKHKKLSQSFKSKMKSVYDSLQIEINKL